jgi:hypothetical protein
VAQKIGTKNPAADCSARAQHVFDHAILPVFCPTCQTLAGPRSFIMPRIVFTTGCSHNKRLIGYEPAKDMRAKTRPAEVASTQQHERKAGSDHGKPGQRQG